VQVQHDTWQTSGGPEEILEPDLPIIDPHHHYWDKHPSRHFVSRYMIEELAADVNCGHNVVSTVYMQSTTAGWARADGPEEMKPVGESELMQGVAVMGESGLYTKCRVAAGIIGTVDLTLGAAVEPVLLAHRAVARNFRGIRFRGGQSESIPFDDPSFIEGLKVLERLGLTWDCCAPPRTPARCLSRALSGSGHAQRRPRSRERPHRPILSLTCSLRGAGGPETHPLDLEGVLGGICRVARACPSLTIIVDHCGGAVGPLCFDAEPEKRAEWERTHASHTPLTPHAQRPHSSVAR